MSIESDVASTVVKTVASPILHYIYGAIIVALIAGGFAAVIHERHVGAAAIAAADAKHAQVVAAKDKVIADNAQLELIDVGQHEKISLAAPPVPNSGLVCKSPSVGTAPGSAEGISQSGKVDQLSAGSFDPSGAILTLLRDDDTRINDLVDTVEILNGYIEMITLTAAQK
jgi:hypothetical protein